MYFNKDIKNIIYNYTVPYYNIIIDNEICVNNLENKLDIENKINDYLNSLYMRYIKFNNKFYEITQEQFLKGINYELEVLYVIKTNKIPGKHYVKYHTIYIKGNKYRLI